MMRLILTVLLLLVVPLGAQQETPYETLVRLRGEYPTPMTKAQVGELLNRTAAAHRDHGVKLLGKATGNNCPMPTGTLISCDYLVHVAGDGADAHITGHDVLFDVGAVASPVPFDWGPGPEDLTDAVNSGARSVVEPFGTAPPPDPDPDPDPTLVQRIAQLEAYAQQLQAWAAAAQAWQDEVAKQIGVLNQQIADLAARPLPPTRCRASVFGIPVACRLEN